MKEQFFIIAMVFISMQSRKTGINGFYLLSNSLEEGIATMNSSLVESKALNNYCRSCKWGVTLLRFHLDAGETVEHILKTGSSLCTNLKMQKPEICEAGVHLFGAEIIRIMRRVEMTTAEICFFLLDDYCEEAAESPQQKWNVSFAPFPKPKVQELKLPKPDAPKLKVLHISDTHVDPLYLEGSNADCGEPLCCQKNDGNLSKSFSSAGKWGDYRCDLPRKTLEHLLDHIMETHKDIDYVIWTGDLVPHDVWKQSNENNMNIIEDTIKLVSEKLNGIQIFPAIGNHERSPANSFPTIEQDSSMASFYNDIDTLWSRWLPINVSRTLQRGAFYSVLIRRGFRIISLNMNVCSSLNFWLVENSTDPLTELQWLIHELQMAEMSKEKVHIIGHIPPGHIDCVRIWSHNYYEIIARYESTVTAQFFGHTHNDEFEVFYDPKNLSRATNIAYIAPSVTPYWNLNPGYRIYYIDGDYKDTTTAVVDHETWVLNLEEANLIDAPVWRKSYIARDAYNMKGLRPIDWDDFISRMMTDDDLFNLYFKNYWKGSPFMPECSSLCKRDILCQAKSGRSHDKLHLCGNLNRTIEKSDKSPEIPHEIGPKSSQTTPCLCYGFVWAYIFTMILTTLFSKNF